ncbi:hypothetical protein V1477_010352 [Vespula maculifrons]|uniref:Uncharacterized protein n=1 Tax=Vespula maculifrons TaxID=7453 RepID=A0ABD2C8C0_VESMC
MSVPMERKRILEKSFSSRRRTIDDCSDTRIGVRDRVADLYASAAVAKDPAHSRTRNTYLEKRRPAVSKNKSTIKIPSSHHFALAIKINNNEKERDIKKLTLVISEMTVKILSRNWRILSRISSNYVSHCLALRFALTKLTHLGLTQEQLKPCYNDGSLIRSNSSNRVFVENKN